MGRMRINPVSDIQKEFLEDSIVRLEGMINYAEAYLKLFMTWKRRYKAEVGATLKAEVEGEVTKLETDFKTYKMDMAAKKEAFQPSGPPPPAVSMPTSSGQEVFIHHLQQEKKDDQDFQMTTKLIRIQGAMN